MAVSIQTFKLLEMKRSAVLPRRNTCVLWTELACKFYIAENNSMRIGCILAELDGNGFCARTSNHCESGNTLTVQARANYFRQVFSLDRTESSCLICGC